MGLIKYKLGDLIEQSFEKNKKLCYSISDVRGISTDKKMIPTKANMDGVSLNNYLLIKPNYFAYVSDTSRRGDKISLCFNDTEETYICSSISTCFYVYRTDILDPHFLFMFFNRPEFDRYSRFNSWGSARETFDWREMCNIEIELPPLEIQKKYVKIYENLINMKNENQRSLCNLKIICDLSIEELRKKYEGQKIGNYLEQTNVQCGENKLIKMMGISNDHTFKKPDSRTQGVDISKYKIVYPNEFGWSPIHINDGSIALNKSNAPYAISPIYSSFKTKSEKLYPDYLFMFFKRNEFVRYCWYHAYGSARDAIQWDSIAEVRIPIPKLRTQKLIATFSKAYEQRRVINDKIKKEIQQICPILIRGSQLEASEN